MVIRLNRPPQMLDKLPPEIRHMVYQNLTHDPNPIATNNQQPIHLQSLLSLRLSSRAVLADLDLTLARLKMTFYKENTFLFAGPRVIWDFALYHSPRDWSSLRTIHVGSRLWKDATYCQGQFRNRLWPLTQILQHLTSMDCVSIYILVRYAGPWSVAKDSRHGNQQSASRRALASLVFVFSTI